MIHENGKKFHCAAGEIRAERLFTRESAQVQVRITLLQPVSPSDSIAAHFPPLIVATDEENNNCA